MPTWEYIDGDPFMNIDRMRNDFREHGVSINDMLYYLETFEADFYQENIATDRTIQRATPEATLQLLNMIPADQFSLPMKSRYVKSCIEQIIAHVRKNP